MARINIDDQFWIDIVNLAIKIGDQDKAIGMAIRFFKVSQENYKNEKLMSEDDFNSFGFDESLIPIFAEKTPNGIKAKGSEKYFDWLNKKKRAGKLGGIKSGEVRRSKTKQNEAKASKRSKSKQTEPSISISSSTSISNSSSSNSICTEQTQFDSLPVEKKNSKSRFDAKDLSEVLNNLPIETLERWSALYPDKEFLQRELIKAFGYYAVDNPMKKPKSKSGWSRALGFWLDRGWAYQAKNIKGNKQNSEVDTNSILNAIKEI